MSADRIADGPALVIGYGSCLRSDDRIGQVAAEHLATRVDGARVEILTLHQLTPELVEPLSRARLAIFVDACLDLAPGQIGLSSVEPAGGLVMGVLAHHLTPAALLAGAAHLYGAAPQAWLVTVGAASFTLGDTLSPAVAEALPRLLDTIEGLLGA